MIRTRTVLFNLPDHPVLLCLLGDFHLHQVSELLLEKRRKLSPSHVCDCSMHARRVPFHVFSCVVLAVLTTRLTDSVDHPLAKNTLGRDIGNHDCRATQNRHTRLSSDLLKKPS